MSNLNRRWLALTLLLTGLFLLGMAALSSAAPPGQTAEEGEPLFQQYCAGCHTVGGGDLVGPDLQGVAARREADWLEHWLAEPDRMIADGDPIAVELLAQYNNVAMPNQHLTLFEIDAILAYLGVAVAHPPAAQQAALVGDPQAGRELFTGNFNLLGGGPACIACHDTAALSAPGGGLLGPDLTQAVVRYGGEAGLRGVLGTIAFPSMVPVYQNRPLSPQEQADLAAFLAQTSTQAPPSKTARYVVILLLAFGVMDVLLIALFWWHRRLPTRRRQPLTRRLGAPRSE